MGRLTERQRAALEEMPVGRQVSEQNLKTVGVSMVSLWSLEAQDLVACTKYANGRFWQITDLGRAALSEAEGGDR